MVSDTIARATATPRSAATLSPPSSTEQRYDLPEHRTALLSDLCSGSFHALHPEVRAQFPVSALDYASSPTRNVVLAPIPPGDGTGLQWIDTGSIGIVGVYDPALMTRDLALTVIERQSGKTPVDITTDEAVATVIGRLAGAR